MSDAGEIRDERGRMLAPLPGGKAHQFTTANAREMQAKRWIKARQAANNWILREAASIEPSVQGWNDAWGFLVAKQYTTLLDSDKPRGDDLYRMGQIIGAVPLSGEVQAQAQAQAPGAITLSLPAEAGALLVDLLRELAGRQVVDADAVTDAE